jgi:hypothetical protein
VSRVRDLALAAEARIEALAVSGWTAGVPVVCNALISLWAELPPDSIDSQMALLQHNKLLRVLRGERLPIFDHLSRWAAWWGSLASAEAARVALEGAS